MRDQSSASEGFSSGTMSDNAQEQKISGADAQKEDTEDESDTVFTTGEEPLSGSPDGVLELAFARNRKLSRELLDTAIQDCYARFILNLPQEYLSNHIQLCFAIQEAYWWYDDYWFDQHTTQLPKLSLRTFGLLLCERCPLLRLYLTADSYGTFVDQWRQYCRTIPLRGAILLNNTLTKVLMVQGWRGGRYMFPRGKVDEHEDDVACAVRELREEIGVDISKVVNPNVYIETTTDEQPLKLFVIPGVCESTPFGPQKRKEILHIRWIPLDKLPGWKRCEKKAATLLRRGRVRVAWPASATTGGLGGLDVDRPRFWNVHPFTVSLYGWVDLLRRGSRPRQRERLLEEREIEEKPVSLNVAWLPPSTPGGFPTPPRGYNLLLEGRYRTLKVDTETALIAEASLLVASQHAAPKPPILPPYIDEDIVYAIPSNTPTKRIWRLQHPQAAAPPQKKKRIHAEDQVAVLPRRPSVPIPEELEEGPQRDVLAAIHELSEKEPQYRDTSSVEREALQISRLAHSALEALNACRERLGRGPLSPEEFTHILGI